MKSQAGQDSLILFKFTPLPQIPISHPLCAEKADSKRSVQIKMLTGKSVKVDFPSDSISETEAYSITRSVFSHAIFLDLRYYILQSFCVQVTTFIIKLLCLTAIGCSFIVMFLNGVEDLLVFIIGASGTILSLIMTILLFYHIGVSFAASKNQLTTCFKFVAYLNFVLSTAFLVGFIYVIREEMQFDSLGFEYSKKEYIEYMLIGGVGLYYLVGTVIFVLIIGIILILIKIIWFIVMFIVKCLTLGLFFDKYYDLRNDNRRNKKVYPEKPDLPYNLDTSSDLEIKIPCSNKNNAFNSERQLLHKENQDPNDQYLPNYENYNQEPKQRVIVKNRRRPLRCVIKEYKDLMQARICGICKNIFYAGENVAGMTCDPMHVFHIDCLKRAQPDPKKGECPLCQNPYFV